MDTACSQQSIFLMELFCLMHMSHRCAAVADIVVSTVRAIPMPSYKTTSGLFDISLAEKR
jgi:hypothetical protein